MLVPKSLNKLTQKVIARITGWELIVDALSMANIQAAIAFQYLIFKNLSILIICNILFFNGVTNFFSRYEQII
ncbi:MAG: hypothetical protein O4751_15980 [Trichodesmium sp. St2_bin6]|nr:hypothetical protein [Trichodesmium sp. St5_bin8]MDE5079684.1 hypothetical protein [Trichodesmium sp. St2_bin6]